MRWLATRLIRLYQRWVSPLLGPACRFHPSCSEYTLQCIEHGGVLHGSLLGAARIARCHPFHPGGFDPPPHLRAGAQDASLAPLLQSPTRSHDGT